jgi:hypothetical protein
MDIRDRARSDLYLAQLRSQSAPNTPGFGPLSPSYSSYAKSPRFPPSAYNTSTVSAAEEGYSGVGTRFVEAKSNASISAKPFALQPPPIKVHAATPKAPQNGFDSVAPPPAPITVKERVREHVSAAPGEQTYDAVPIPSAYASTLNASSAGVGYQPQHTRFGSVGEAITSDKRIESPPGSPRGWK